MRLEGGFNECSDIAQALVHETPNVSLVPGKPVRVGMLNVLKATQLRKMGLDVPLGIQTSEARKRLLNE